MMVPGRRSSLAFAVLAMSACASTPTAPVSQPTPAQPATPPASAKRSAALVDFERALQEMGMVYELPVGFVETPVVPNQDVSYDYAVASRDRSVEMRFTLRPRSSWPADMPDATREQISWPFFMTAIANITRGGQIGETAPPQRLDLKSFGAEEAKMVVIRISAENDDTTSFAHGFTICSVVYLHKAAAGDAYVFVLAKDVDAFGTHMTEEKFHALRFAEARPR